MDKNGKLFGKISIIDIIVVVVLILCLVGAYMRFGGRAAQIVSKSTPIDYTVEIKGVRAFTVDGLKKMGACSDQKTKKYVGDIVEVVESPAQGVLQMADGSFLKAPVPERFDVLVTIRTDGKMDDRTFFNNQNSEITAGSYYEVISAWVHSSGEIKYVKAVEPNAVEAPLAADSEQESEQTEESAEATGAEESPDTSDEE